ncbi:MAG: hypothetical protein CHKLHMKO_00134 [Candidatus Argoarchaeum ethanivorans]|uniref:Cohesin domain-containing protein n=1 Tax=Candidatus Argoarchaeum ethanivorans TaxID=2608793 RepID=A0A811T9N2_9EURY|nr:MAG: hypothetical protein CHKLHMKO_00134 [Candidatus Argoarchaeum ethanivorans]
MNSKGRKIGIAAATLALLFLLTLGATTAGATTVSVEPSAQDVQGNPFSVDINVTDVTYMGMDQVVLNFDPSAMEATGITEGGFLKSAGTTIPVELIDNIAGTVTFSYSLTTANVGVTGSGTLATINFTTELTALGEYPLNLTDVALSDGDGTPITTVDVNGTVNVTAPGPPAAVPALSGIGMIALIGALAIVLAISVSTMRRKRRN